MISVYNLGEGESIDEKTEPNFWSILPATVRYHKTLKDGAKLLFSEITALSNMRGYCNAGNAALAKNFGKSQGCISKYISDLNEANLVDVILIRNQKGEIIERRIFPKIDAKGTYLNAVNPTEGMVQTSQRVLLELARGYSSNEPEGIVQTSQNNNTINNNTINNTNISSFENFYKEYPRRLCKKAALKAYDKALKIASPEEILLGLSKYKAYIEKLKEKALKDKNTFVPDYAYPASWLNGERWKDDYENNFMVSTPKERYTDEQLKDPEFYKPNWFNLTEDEQKRSIKLRDIKTKIVRLRNYPLRYTDEQLIDIDFITKEWYNLSVEEKERSIELRKSQSDPIQKNLFPNL